MRTPFDLSEHIRTAGIKAELLPMSMNTPTVPAAAAALGVDAAQIVKSLLFLIGRQPVLVIASGTSLVDRRPLADHYGVGKKQIKLADETTVLEITGYPAGGVPPFGHATTVPVFMDSSLRAWDVVYGGGGDDRTLVRIEVDELERVAGGEWLELGKSDH